MTTLSTHHNIVSTSEPEKILKGCCLMYFPAVVVVVVVVVVVLKLKNLKKVNDIKTQG